MSLQTQWRYKAIPLKSGFASGIRPEDVEDTLDTLGNQGRDLVHVPQPAMNPGWRYLKRPKP